MKKIFTHTLYLLVILFLQQTTFAQTPTGSSVPAFKQEQTQWCWAACGSMIYYVYHTGTISQCAFVRTSQVRGNTISSDCRYLPSKGDPCSTPSAFNKPQILFDCYGSIRDVLNSYGISSTRHDYAFSTSQLSSAMGARKMCIAGWGWNGGGGHVVVVNRYKNGNVYLNDPYWGARIMTYSNFKRADGQGTWIQTLCMTTAPRYSTPLYRTADAKPEVE